MPAQRTAKRPPARTAARRPQAAAAAAEAEEATDAAATAADDDEDEDPFESAAANQAGGYDDAEDFTLDMSDVSEEIQFDTFPPGKYPGEISDIEFGESQSSGKPMLTWHVDVTGVTTKGEERTRTMRFYTVLADTGLSRLKKLVNRLTEAYEEDPYDWSHFKASEIMDRFVGYEVTAVVRVGRDRVDPKIKRNNISDLLAREDDEAGFAEE